MATTTKQKVKTFTDLETWKHGHTLVLEVYRATKSFPKEELFGLTSQIRRCAVSITSNIAEGFSRDSAKEKRQFYVISLGSLAELQNQLLIARDIGLIEREQLAKLAQQTVTVRKLIHGLRKSIQA